MKHTILLLLVSTGSMLGMHTMGTQIALASTTLASAAAWKYNSDEELLYTLLAQSSQQRSVDYFAKHVGPLANSFNSDPSEENKQLLANIKDLKNKKEEVYREKCSIAATYRTRKRAAGIIGLWSAALLVHSLWYSLVYGEQEA